MSASHNIRDFFRLFHLERYNKINDKVPREKKQEMKSVFVSFDGTKSRHKIATEK